ncbi:hypothetical protein KGQ20_37120 [Catenulispora sp. NF23]|uniref:hypothetical protein n=1 Tax=Catenulispora pinistramenti TaxID=2705254 RepID=UPI001BA98931|nr:hypothetical protein [Catenulispora pinistramenti]MBS2538387.1 hypothetical protein [Catenulispora pinistramenti]
MTALAAARPAIVRTLAATVGLTAAWGLVSGATQHHFAYACLLVGLVLARCLTKTPAPRTAHRAAPGPGRRPGLRRRVHR